MLKIRLLDLLHVHQQRLLVVLPLHRKLAGVGELIAGQLHRHFEAVGVQVAEVIHTCSEVGGGQINQSVSPLIIVIVLLLLACAQGFLF